MLKKEPRPTGMDLVRAREIVRSLPPLKGLSGEQVCRRCFTSDAGQYRRDFAGRGITSRHGPDNAAGIAHILEWLRGANDGFLFANLVDFDQLFGHRNDISGFYQALRQFDAALPELLLAMREDDLLFVTADHGNDPTTPSTDHARECVLCWCWAAVSAP